MNTRVLGYSFAALTTRRGERPSFKQPTYKIMKIYENISYPEYSVSVVKNVRMCIETFAESGRETIARVTSNPKGNCWGLVPIDVPKGTKKLCSKARLDLDSLLLI